MNIKLKSGGIGFDLYNQWEAVFSREKMNWVDFTFILLAVESSPYKCSNEVTLGLLGLTLTITVWREAENRGSTSEQDSAKEHHSEKARAKPEPDGPGSASQQR